MRPRWVSLRVGRGRATLSRAVPRAGAAHSPRAVPAPHSQGDPLFVLLIPEGDGKCGRTTGSYSSFRGAMVSDLRDPSRALAGSSVLAFPHSIPGPMGRGYSPPRCPAAIAFPRAGPWVRRSVPLPEWPPGPPAVGPASEQPDHRGTWPGPTPSPQPSVRPPSEQPDRRGTNPGPAPSPQRSVRPASEQSSRPETSGPAQSPRPAQPSARPPARPRTRRQM
ncbi:hypothetical protein BH18CHL1_BH18CHL1_08510 [soil metagenome]